MEKVKSNNQVVKSWPDLMTESELVEYLRIPLIAKTENYKNVVDNLKRTQGLPSVHICRQPLYPLAAVRRWVEEKVEKEQGL